MSSLPPPDRSPGPTPLPAGELLEQVLTPLLDDFRFWFRRGEQLLAICPEGLLEPARRLELLQQLTDGQAEIQASLSLRQAIDEPVALELSALVAWHRRVLEVWSLAAKLRAAGLALPPLPDPPAPPQPPAQL